MRVVLASLHDAGPNPQAMGLARGESLPPADRPSRPVFSTRSRRKPAKKASPPQAPSGAHARQRQSVRTVLPQGPRPLVRPPLELMVSRGRIAIPQRQRYSRSFLQDVAIPAIPVAIDSIAVASWSRASSISIGSSPKLRTISAQAASKAWQNWTQSIGTKRSTVCRSWSPYSRLTKHCHVTLCPRQW